MRSIGIDLAASPATTAVAVLHWDGGAATADPPRLRCTDDDLLAHLTGLRPGERAGVDCPFGWPIPFIQAITAHARHEAWPGRGTTSTEHRPSLRHRRTDIAVRQALAPSLQPLSVSFDKLGATAARWAHLADELAHRGHPVERTGTGPVVEVYPKAARLRWQLGTQRSMDDLMKAAPFLHCSPQVREEYERNEHAFDALVAALVARACAKGLTRPPEPEDAPAAAIEGWIHLPDAGSLHSLL